MKPTTREFWKSVYDATDEFLQKIDSGGPRIDPSKLTHASLVSESHVSGVMARIFRSQRLAAVKAAAQAHSKLWRHPKETTTPKGKFTKTDQEDIQNEILDAVEELWASVPGDIEQSLVDAAQSGAARGLIDLKVNDSEMINSVNSVARDWARDRAAELVGMKYNEDDVLIPNPDAEWAITEETRSQIRSIVTSAFEDETRMPDLINSIENAGAFSPSRAAMIARTEVTMAQQAGNYEAWQQSGVVGGVKWLMSEDHDDPDVCDDNDDVVVAIGELFPSGDYFPPCHPNCWCICVATLIADDELEAISSGDLRKSSAEVDCEWVTISGTHLCIGGEGTIVKGPEQLVGLQSNAARAKLSYVPATKEMQDKGDEWGRKIRDTIGGKLTADNSPADIIKGNNAVEVKTIQTSKKDRVEMRPDSRAKKDAFVKAEKMTGHTIAIDLRGTKPQIYYHEGFGAFRFGSMEKVTLGELKAKFK